ncbi:hypothetical protein JHK87_006580 [Glycine soja]|nr:hypothetical protein JHK87_006580 [Glycine soja]
MLLPMTQQYLSGCGNRVWEVLLFLVYKFPPSLTVPLSLKSPLGYGENPHQKAAFYVDKSLSEVNAGGIATAIQHHGKVGINY